MKELLVTAQWDDEAKVWVSTSRDISGMATEAPSLDALLERVLAVAPELLEDNAYLLEGDSYAGDLIDMLIESQFLPAGVGAH
jgi:hypothetical protein